MTILASRLDRFQASRISQTFNLATKLKEAGRDLVDLSIGEPDFETPDHVIEAAAKAMREGATKYTPVEGTSAMKRAAAAKFQRDNNLNYEIDQILVTAGAKPMLFLAFHASLDPGDEVIIPAPCWTSYPDMVRLAGGTPVIVECGEDVGFKLTAEKLKNAITEKTKWLVLNSPSNPTGATYSSEELKALTDVLLDHSQVWVIADDIYEHLLFDGRVFATPAAVEPRLYERTLTINGVSKCYAMTGWRIGYAGGPDVLIKGMRKVLSQSTGNPSSISQAAAIAALEGPQDFLAERAESFRHRRDLVCQQINGIPGLTCPRPEGAFYAYVGCRELLGRKTPAGATLEDSAAVAQYFMAEGGVVLVPGVAFALDPYLRLSYAASRESLEKAFDRLREACGKLA